LALQDVCPSPKIETSFLPQSTAARGACASDSTPLVGLKELPGTPHAHVASQPTDNRKNSRARGHYPERMLDGSTTHTEHTHTATSHHHCTHIACTFRDRSPWSLQVGPQPAPKCRCWVRCTAWKKHRAGITQPMHASTTRKHASPPPCTRHTQRDRSSHTASVSKRRHHARTACTACE
jgi:hypothetical protein